MILNLDLKYCDIFKIPFIPHLFLDSTDLKTVAEYVPDPESLRKTNEEGRAYSLEKHWLEVRLGRRQPH